MYNVYIYIYTYIHTYIHTYVYIYIYIHICIYVHTCIYIYTCVYTHLPRVRAKQRARSSNGRGFQILYSNFVLYSYVCLMISIMFVFFFFVLLLSLLPLLLLLLLPLLLWSSSLLPLLPSFRLSDYGNVYIKTWQYIVWCIIAIFLYIIAYGNT